MATCCRLLSTSERDAPRLTITEDVRCTIDAAPESGAVDDMRSPTASQHYHIARFDRTIDAAAFVAALTRYLDSPRSGGRRSAGDTIEVWSDAEHTHTGFELYLSDDAVAATRESFAAPPLSGTRTGESLAADCALVVGMGAPPLTEATAAKAHLDAHKRKRRQT